MNSSDKQFLASRLAEVANELREFIDLYADELPTEALCVAGAIVRLRHAAKRLGGRKMVIELPKEGEA